MYLALCRVMTGIGVALFSVAFLVYFSSNTYADDPVPSCAQHNTDCSSFGESTCADDGSGVRYCSPSPISCKCKWGGIVARCVCEGFAS